MKLRMGQERRDARDGTHTGNAVEGHSSLGSTLKPNRGFQRKSNLLTRDPGLLASKIMKKKILLYASAHLLTKGVHEQDTEITGTDNKEHYLR